MNQLYLFDDSNPSPPPKAAPFVRGSETSQEAAERIEPFISGMAREVFDAIHSRGKQGATCDEVEKLTGIKHQTCSARICDLVKSKHIIRTDRKRNTQTGRPAKVHVAKDFADA